MDNKMINIEEVASIYKVMCMTSNYKIKNSLRNWLYELTGDCNNYELYSVLFRNKVYEISSECIRAMREDISTIEDGSELDIKKVKDTVNIKAYEPQEVVSKNRKLVFSKKYKVGA